MVFKKMMEKWCQCEKDESHAIKKRDEVKARATTMRMPWQCNTMAASVAVFLSVVVEVVPVDGLLAVVLLVVVLLPEVLAVEGVVAVEEVVVVFFAEELLVAGVVLVLEVEPADGLEFELEVAAEAVVPEADIGVEAEVVPG